MSNVYEESLKLHEVNQGKLSVISKVSVKNREDLSLAYSPGVAEPCRKIHENKEEVYRYTSRGNMVAVITDGTAVLGDRKSTRLNSSHANISYAVFCLKKKTATTATLGCIS